jgi:CelD/BcsL family acetyltransferase involved in cellulose biosynthesis
MQISVIDDVRGLERLKPEWEALHEESAADGLFASWLWAELWTRHFGRNEPLRIVTARDDQGHLLGIAPMSIATRKVARTLAVKTLQFIGASAPVEHFDFVIRRGREGEVLPRLLTTLCSMRVDAIALNNILPDSPTVALLRASGDLTEEQGHVAPYLVLPESMDTLLASIPKSRRDRFRFFRRRIDRYSPDWTLTQLATREELLEGFDQLVRLHDVHWKSRGEPGTFGSPELTAFYRELALALFDRGWMRLNRLMAGGKVVSVEYAFEFRKRFHVFTNGTDFDAGVESAGAVLQYLLIERAIAAGMREYDFMWGEEEYKLKWGAEPRHDVTFVQELSTRARVVRQARAVWKAVRARIGAPAVWSAVTAVTAFAP